MSKEKDNVINALGQAHDKLTRVCFDMERIEHKLSINAMDAVAKALIDLVPVIGDVKDED